MTVRFAPIVAATLVLLVAACAASPAAPALPTPRGPGTGVAVPTPVPEAPTERPIATPAETPTPVVPDEGNVDAIAYPELTVERLDDGVLSLQLQDPTAKAWRLEVAGTGDLAADRFVIEVETGDVGPVISATEIRAGRTVDEMDLSGYVDGTAAAGGCHATLRICIDSDGFRLPDEGDGLFAMRLSVADATAPLTITGSTAGWPSEPFILGPWVVAEPFTWGPG